MNYFFWLLLNIGVPLFGPIGMLATVAVSYGRPIAKQLIFESVKDGQLFWSAISLSAAAVYELIAALDKAVLRATIPFSEATFSMPHWVMQSALAAFIACAFLSSLLVMLTTLKTLQNSIQTETLRSALSPDARTSIWLTGSIAISFAILHFLIG